MKNFKEALPAIFTGLALGIIAGTAIAMRFAV